MSVYPSTTHWSPVMPPPRSDPIAGNATLTTRASSVTMKKPSTATSSAGRGPREDIGATSAGTDRLMLSTVLGRSTTAVLIRSTVLHAAAT
jgi:hypothetical protein